MTVRLTKKGKKEIDDFINRLVQMKHEAGRLGMYKTMHALEHPQKQVGWEYAEMIEKGRL